jgi:hypothetical protein
LVIFIIFVVFILLLLLLVAFIFFTILIIVAVNRALHFWLVNVRPTIGHNSLR